MVLSTTKHSQLSFESLEPKHMMAGDVAVALVDGHVIVHGDSAGNQVALLSAGRPDAVAVVGLQDTTVAFNGQLHAPGSAVVVDGLQGNLIARLGDGDDRLAVVDARLAQNLVIDAGDGDDVIALRNVAARAASIDGGDGDDGLTILGGNFRRELALNGGGGADVIHLRHATVHGVLAIDAGEGEDRDTVAIDHTRARRTHVALGGGDDHLRVLDSAFKVLSASGGAGQDRVVLGNIATADALVLDGGADDDLLILLGQNRVQRALVGSFDGVVQA